MQSLGGDVGVGEQGRVAKGKVANDHGTHDSTVVCTIINEFEGCILVVITILVALYWYSVVCKHPLA